MDAQTVLHWRVRSAVFNFPSRMYVSVMVCVFPEVGNSELEVAHRLLDLICPQNRCSMRDFVRVYLYLPDLAIRVVLDKTSQQNVGYRKKKVYFWVLESDC